MRRSNMFQAYWTTFDPAQTHDELTHFTAHQSLFGDDISGN
jgi:hypothetical protein